MFDIRVFNALATQTSIKICQISFNVTTPYFCASGVAFCWGVVCGSDVSAGHCHVNRKFTGQMSMAATVHTATVAWRHVSIA